MSYLIPIATIAAHKANLSAKDAAFASSLIDSVTKYGKASEKQLYWLNELAARATAGPKPAPAGTKVGDDLSALNSLFDRAAQKLKNPAFLVMNEAGQRFRISRAKPNSTNPSFAYVKSADTDAYLGKVSPAGEFFGTREAKDFAVTATLAAFLADPAGQAARFGKLTGNCCFCTRPLTHENSTEVGYGPICADNYGLPWGAKVAEAA